MKICVKCSIKKPLNDFHKHKIRKDGYREICKLCRKPETKKYIEENFKILSEKKKIYYQENKDKIKIKHREYHKIWSKKNNPKRIEYLKKWKILNPNYDTEYVKKRKKKDILFKIKLNIRRRTNLFLKEKCISLNATELIGIDYHSFKEYFEKLFYGGMTWENYGEWEIDHIIPLSSIKTEEEIYQLAKYTNLQPLWKKDNKEKSNKLNWEPQKS
jgi:preprotein translocase subunit Sss1